MNHILNRLHSVRTCAAKAYYDAACNLSSKKAAVRYVGFLAMITPTMANAADYDWPWIDPLLSLVETFTGATGMLLAALGLIFICIGFVTGEGRDGLTRGFRWVVASCFLFAVWAIVTTLRDNVGGGSIDL